LFIEHLYGQGDAMFGGLKATVQDARPWQRINRGGANIDGVRRWLLLA